MASGGPAVRPSGAQVAPRTGAMLGGSSPRKTRAVKALPRLRRPGHIALERPTAFGGPGQNVAPTDPTMLGVHAPAPMVGQCLPGYAGYGASFRCPTPTGAGYVLPPAGVSSPTAVCPVPSTSRALGSVRAGQPTSAVRARLPGAGRGMHSGARRHPQGPGASNTGCLSAKPRATRAVSSGTCEPGWGLRDRALAPHTRGGPMAFPWIPREREFATSILNRGGGKLSSKRGARHTSRGHVSPHSQEERHGPHDRRLPSLPLPCQRPQRPGP
jgi:hypothetical protein